MFISNSIFFLMPQMNIFLGKHMRLQTVVIGFLYSKKSIHILYFFVPFPSFLIQYVYGREREIVTYYTFSHIIL